MTRLLPRPAGDAVVAEWAVDDVVACLGVDGIVAVAAGDDFIAFATEDAACCFWGINNVFTCVCKNCTAAVACDWAVIILGLEY